jgi:mannosyltransferase
MFLERLVRGIKNTSNAIQQPSWRTLVFLVLPLSLILRVPKLQSRPIWYDEAFSIFLSRQSLREIVAGTAADTMPPLYYFLLKGWMFLCNQVWFLRTLSVIFSLGIIVLVYMVTSRWFNQRAGLWAALFTAVSPLQIYHAQEIRMYALLTLALFAYIIFFMRLWDERGAGRASWINIIGLVLSGTAAMYSHNLAIFSIVVPNFLLVFRREWRFLSRLVVAQMGIGLLWLPWLVFVPTQITKIQTAFWTPQPGLREILQTIITFHTNLPLPEWFLPIAVFTSLLTMTLVVYEIVKVTKGNQVIHSLLLFTFLPALLLFIASYLMRPIFVPRAIMLSSLTYYVLAGRVVSDADNRVFALILCLLIILPALTSLPTQYTFESFPRSPFQAAADDLAVITEEGDALVHDNKLSYFPMHFYQPELPQDFIADTPGSHNDTFAPESQLAMGIFPVTDLDSAVGSAKHVWFVIFQRAIDEYASIGEPNHPQLAWLLERFSMADVRTYNDLLIYEFTR